MSYRNKIIGKLNFGDVDLVYGLELCLHVANINAIRVTSKTASGCDILLVSLCWYRDVIDLARLISQVDFSNVIIIAGGIQATQIPELIACLVDYVFIGDGEEDLRQIIDDIIDEKRPSSKHVYAMGDTIIPPPKQLSPRPFLLRRKKINNIRSTAYGNWVKFSGDNSDKKIAYRIEIARGCHYKCAHCELSALKPYAEVDAESVINLMRKIPRGSHVGIFAPDRTSHSGWSDIAAAIVEFGLQDWGADTRMERISDVPRYTAFIGLDGISFQMRRSVGKGYNDDFIFEKLKEFISTGARRVSGGMVVFYYVCDLPGETNDDWMELNDFYKKLSSFDWSRNLRIRPILNPLSPKPHTKLANAIIHPLNNYPSRWIRFLHGGDGNSRWGVRVFDTRVWGPLERALDLIVERGNVFGADLLCRLPAALMKRPDDDKSDIGAQIILREASRLGLTKEKLLYE